MKNILVPSVLLLVLVLPAIGRTATVGNPADVLGGDTRFSIGFETDGILNRRMGIEHTIPEYKSVYPARENDNFSNFKLKSNRNLIKFTYGYFTNMDIYLKAGVAASTIYARDNTLGQNVRWVGKYGIAWGLGSKVKLYEVSGLKLLARMRSI